jgi:hypothetical protein
VLTLVKKPHHRHWQWKPLWQRWRQGSH